MEGGGGEAAGDRGRVVVLYYAVAGQLREGEWLEQGCRNERQAGSRETGINEQCRMRAVGRVRRWWWRWSIELG